MCSAAACKSIKSEHTLSPYTQKNSKWLKDLNTIKLLEEIIGKTFSDITYTNVFLDQSPKATETKNKQDLIRLTSFCIAKESIRKTKTK